MFAPRDFVTGRLVTKTPFVLTSPWVVPTMASPASLILATTVLGPALSLESCKRLPVTMSMGAVRTTRLVLLVPLNVALYLLVTLRLSVQCLVLRPRLLVTSMQLGRLPPTVSVSESLTSFKFPKQIPATPHVFRNSR